MVSRTNHSRLLSRQSLPAMLVILGACATGSRQVEKLPFHVAIAPAEPEVERSRRDFEGDPTELQLAFDAKELMARLDSSVSQTFDKVSRLSPATNAQSGMRMQEWVAEARQKGADLVLVPSVRYDPRIHTSINGQFWPNLLLFAVGGPFCWWIPDRSYYCYSRLDGELVDVDATGRRPTLDPQSRVMSFKLQSTEAALNFQERADGVGAYLVSLICPAGFLSASSQAIPRALGSSVVDQLCVEMSKSLQDGARLILESDVVDFFPRNVGTVRDQQGAALAGEFELQLGAADGLGRLRYRMDGVGQFRNAEWTQGSGAEADGGRQVYRFRIPLDTAPSGTVQLWVEQNDAVRTGRTFTFAIDRAPQK